MSARQAPTWRLALLMISEMMTSVSGEATVSITPMLKPEIISQLLTSFWMLAMKSRTWRATGGRKERREGRREEEGMEEGGVRPGGRRDDAGEGRDGMDSLGSEGRRRRTWNAMELNPTHLQMQAPVAPAYLSVFQPPYLLPRVVVGNDVDDVLAALACADGCLVDDARQQLPADHQHHAVRARHFLIGRAKNAPRIFQRHS